jgi:hypothetical protein
LDGRNSFTGMVQVLGGTHERFLCFLPLSHAYAHSVYVGVATGIGATIHFAESVDKLSANMLEVLGVHGLCGGTRPPAAAAAIQWPHRMERLSPHHVKGTAGRVTRPRHHVRPLPCDVELTIARPCR